MHREDEFSVACWQRSASESEELHKGRSNRIQSGGFGCRFFVRAAQEGISRGSLKRAFETQAIMKEAEQELHE